MDSFQTVPIPLRDVQARRRTTNRRALNGIPNPTGFNNTVNFYLLPPLQKKKKKKSDLNTSINTTMESGSFYSQECDTEFRGFSAASTTRMIHITEANFCQLRSNFSIPTNSSNASVSAIRNASNSQPIVKSNHFPAYKQHPHNSPLYCCARSTMPYLRTRAVLPNAKSI